MDFSVLVVMWLVCCFMSGCGAAEVRRERQIWIDTPEKEWADRQVRQMTWIVAGLAALNVVLAVVLDWWFLLAIAALAVGYVAGNRETSWVGMAREQREKIYGSSIQ